MPHNQDPDPYLPLGLPTAELRDPQEALASGLSREQARRAIDAYRKLPRRSRYVLTVRLGLDVQPSTLKATAEPLALSLDRVRQLQLHALDALAQAAAGPTRNRPEPGSLRGNVIATLRLLARDATGGARIDRTVTTNVLTGSHDAPHHAQRTRERDPACGQSTRIDGQHHQ